MSIRDRLDRLDKRQKELEATATDPIAIYREIEDFLASPAGRSDDRTADADDDIREIERFFFS